MASSNLAIMPSFHEGFGLVGWEAIGCEVPLILGRETGLFRFITDSLGGAGEGCVHGIPIRGGDFEYDHKAIASKVRHIARDLERARSDAKELRRRLIAEKGCTWRHAALTLLQETQRQGVAVPRSAVDTDYTTGNVGDACNRRSSPARAVSTENNYFEKCAELEVSVGQGSTAHYYNVIVELRFGVTYIKVDDLSAEIFVREARLSVSPEGGRLRGERFGEGKTHIAGIQVDAGGVWVLTSPNGSALRGRMLGDEILCRIETPPNVPAAATIELTADRNNLGCDIRLPENEEMTVAAKRIMEIFLTKAIVQQSSGHIVLSQASLRESDCNA